MIDDEVRLKRAGGPGSPGKDIPDHWLKTESQEGDTEWMDFHENEDPESKTKDGQSESGRMKKEEPPVEEERIIKKHIPVVKNVTRLYNMEIIIHTVSNQRYYAKMNLKDKFKNGELDEKSARAALQSVENDLKFRTFRRPITYIETSKGEGESEFIFNPANVICINIIRKY